MQEFWNQVVDSISAYTPSILGAVAILIIGWIVAAVISIAVRAALRRTTLDNKLAGWMIGDEKSKGIDVEQWIARTVFYIVLLFVLLAFFEALDLQIITEPLNRFLTAVFEFLPRLLGAAALLLVAWIIASLARMVIRRALGAIRLDERVGSQVGKEGEARVEFSNALSEVAYWLVFLLFLPAILGVLALQGLLDPVQGMLDNILGFLPNIFAAGLIGVVGWFVARIVQRIVTGLLVAAGTDRLAERVGLARIMGHQHLSGLIGIIVYVLILIPVLIAALNALGLDAVTQPASRMLEIILTALPNIFAAVLLMVIAYIVGRIVSRLAADLLARAGFNAILVRLGLATEPASGERTPSVVAGYLILVGILLFAAIESARLLGFEVVAALVSQFTVFLGQVVLGLAIFAVGLFLANLAAGAVSASKTTQARLLAMVTRIAIMVLAGAMALRQMGIANDIVNLAFGLTLGGVVAAGVLAFGLGGREVAGRELQGWIDGLKSQKK